MMDFEPFGKIPRLKRELVITEKLDGSNAQVCITPFNAEDVDDPHVIATWMENGSPALAMRAGSRTRWIAPAGTVYNGTAQKGCDNFGFARWAQDNGSDLFTLGEGRHYGEWYGSGIQRGYGLDEKRFALFNTARWGAHNPDTPVCCEVTQIVKDVDGPFASADEALEYLFEHGSFSVPGYHNPEGIVVYLTASRGLFKMTFGMDGKWKQG